MENSKTRIMEGKVAIVTGAASGIGREVALRLGQEGCSIMVVDIDPLESEETVSLVRQCGSKADSISCDVSSSSQVDKLVNRTIEIFSHVDILVNNAGVCISNNLENISDTEWDKVISVNLSGTFYCCRAILPHFKSQKSGIIINISSQAGRRYSIMGGVHYSASKAGILGLTRHLAHEVAGQGIRVNAICPGAINTRMQFESLTPEQLNIKAQSIPLARLGEPKDVANCVFFLSSEESAFITGVTIDVNGGTLMI